MNGDGERKDWKEKRLERKHILERIQGNKREKNRD